jgi:hypothetical protein
MTRIISLTVDVHGDEVTVDYSVQAPVRIVAQAGRHLLNVIAETSEFESDREAGRAALLAHDEIFPRILEQRAH